MSVMKSGEIQYDPPLKKYNTDFLNFSGSNYDAFGRRRTTIIGTLGDPDVTIVDIQNMMEAGMNVARFVTYTSTTDDKLVLLAKVDKAAKVLAQKYGIDEWPCATCIELKTCYVRTGIIDKDRPFIQLKENTEIILTHNVAEFNKCNESKLFVDNPYITSDVEVGMEISIKQDKIILKVKEILGDCLKCVVIKEGMLYDMEPVCMPGAKRNRPYITKKDLELVKFAVEYQVDILFINYVRHPNSIREIKKYIGPNLRRPFILSGICTAEGLCNLDDIVKETDGMILSRGLLAYELDRSMFYRMGLIQKFIIGKCLQAGKPLFISGQVFELSLKSGTVAHEDVADVTNSLLEGASGFIVDVWDNIDELKLAIRELSEVCAEIEPFTNSKENFERYLTGMNLPLNAAVATAVSSVLLANQMRAHIIIIPTVSGRTIYYLNSMRPTCMIIAVTTNVNTFRLLQVHRSVIPVLFTEKAQIPFPQMMSNRIGFAVRFALDKGYLRYGDYYITLEKGTEPSSYCDTVKACKVTS